MIDNKCYFSHFRVSIRWTISSLKNLITGSNESVFGSEENTNTNLTVEQFHLFADDQEICFNLEEGTGNTVNSRCGTRIATIMNTEDVDFDWIVAEFATITEHPTSYGTTVGEIITLSVNADDWIDVQWYKNNEILDGEDALTLTVNVAIDDIGSEYFAVFRNRFSSITTHKANLYEQSLTFCAVLFTFCERLFQLMLSDRII